MVVQDLNEKWDSLKQLTAERATQLGSAHEVQRFHRDVDETKDWIQEKDEALNDDDLGKDLRSVQALQRKHEGLERDLAALGDKVRLHKPHKPKTQNPQKTEQDHLVSGIAPITPYSTGFRIPPVSSMQLRRSWDCCQSRRKCAMRRLGGFLEGTRFCSYCVGLYSAPTRRRG